MAASPSPLKGLSARVRLHLQSILLVTVHLHGEDILVRYHSTHVQSALDFLEQFGSGASTNPFQRHITVLSWREHPLPDSLFGP